MCRMQDPIGDTAHDPAPEPSTPMRRHRDHVARGPVRWHAVCPRHSPIQLQRPSESCGRYPAIDRRPGDSQRAAWRYPPSFTLDLFSGGAQILLRFAQHGRVCGSKRYVALARDASPKRCSPG